MLICNIVKKILIIGADIPTGAKIEKLISEKQRGITVINNNHEIKDVMRSEWLLGNKNIEPFVISASNCFDKPKSKYHK